MPVTKKYPVYDLPDNQQILDLDYQSNNVLILFLPVAYLSCFVFEEVWIEDV